VDEAVDFVVSREVYTMTAIGRGSDAVRQHVFIHVASND
jgi:hypothetical protein